MLKAKIKISQVNNLTDARYFSAWGVEYLGFDIDPSSSFFMPPQLVREIMDWVEGPKIFLEAPANTNELWLQNYIQEVGPLPVEQPLPEAKNLLFFRDILSADMSVMTYRNNKSWSEISASLITHLVHTYDLVFVDIPFHVADIDKILDSGVCGFVLHGGGEEKTGFKSYDSLDDIFESLIIS